MSLVSPLRVLFSILVFKLHFTTQQRRRSSVCHPLEFMRYVTIIPTNFTPESPHVSQQVPCALQHSSLFCPWPRAPLLSAIDGQDPPLRCRLPKTLQRRTANAAKPQDGLLPRSATRAKHQQCDITFVLSGEHDVSLSEDLSILPSPFPPCSPHHETPRAACSQST